MGCLGAKLTTGFALSLLLFALFGSLAVAYYRRRLAQANELLTRKPFDDLYAELIDLDMPFETIFLNRSVGQGAFGTVFGGEAKRNGLWEAVAVKVINEKVNYEGKISFLSEAKLMRSLDHPNVVRLIGISVNPTGSLYLIMELMMLGDLKTYLLSRRILAQRSPDHFDICPSTLTAMAGDIAHGVAYLHSRHLIHRDVALRNCLVGTDHVVKIGDFGLTRETSNNPENCYRFVRTCELPIRWMSPESIQFGVFSEKSDIWSYGITLYEIITFGVFPYYGLEDIDVVERVKRAEFSITDFLPPTAYNTIVWHIIHGCCQYHAQARHQSMRLIINLLADNPDCIRPCLTDDPPPPNPRQVNSVANMSSIAAVSSQQLQQRPTPLDSCSSLTALEGGLNQPLFTPTSAPATTQSDVAGDAFNQPLIAHDVNNSLVDLIGIGDCEQPVSSDGNIIQGRYQSPLAPPPASRHRRCQD